MGAPHLAPGKKRYSVSLTAANVEKFQSLCRQIGLPTSTLSSACDDIIRDLTIQWAGVLEKKLKGETYGINDLFTAMGQQIQLLMEEEKKEVKHADVKKPRKAASLK